MVEIIRTDNFLRRLKRIDKSLLVKVEKLVLKIISNPEIGKPMRYDREGTRELYISPFRLSYAYKKEVLVFLDIYHKDKQ